MENRNASSRNESPRPPLARDCGASLFNRFTLLSFRVAKSLRRACLLDCFSSLKKPVSKETALEKFTVFWGCSVFVEAGELGMEDLAEKAGGSLRDVDSEVECFRSDLVDDEERNGDNSSSDTSSSEEPQSSTGSEGSTRPDPLGWPMQKRSGSSLLGYDGLHYYDYDGEVVKFDPVASDGGGFMEVKMMKERFSKLLLGEDMSGCGTGACTALAISNAITNLCAAIFGQLRRLEPLSPEQKSIWQREMEWLLCVGNYVVELVPSRKTFPDGSNLEVMTCKQRSDLYINLPALQKLDNMLLEILDSFKDPEFWYIDEGRLAAERNGSCSFQRPSHLQQEKWWLPLPCVSPGGLNQEARKQVEHKRERASQILKAAMAINSNALAEMEIPESYLDSLPKSGRACLGDVIYRYLTRSHFSPERLLDCLVLASEHQALEIADGVEASIHVWRRTKVANPNTSYSWGVIKGMMFEPEKRELLADRAETLLLHLKQRLPGLAQTALDTSKIQFNKDVGKSILEGYSRVVESLAFKIFSRIEDLLHADDMAKRSDQLSAVGPASVLVHKRSPSADSVLASSTQIATPAFSPAPSVSPSRGGVSPFIKRRPRNRGFGVKRVVTEYLGVQMGR